MWLWVYPPKTTTTTTTNKHQQWERVHTFLGTFQHRAKPSFLYSIPPQKENIFFSSCKGIFFLKLRGFFSPKIHLFLLVTELEGKITSLFFLGKEREWVSSPLHIFAEAEIISRNGALKRKALLALIKTHFHSSLELYCIVPQVEVFVQYQNWAEWNGILSKRRQMYVLTSLNWSGPSQIKQWPWVLKFKRGFIFLFFLLIPIPLHSTVIMQTRIDFN